MPDQSEYRIVVFGAAGVGKTSLVMRFIRGTYTDGYTPTIEDTYSQVIQCDKSVCTLQITDTTGSHHFPAMQQLAIARANAFIMVYSISDSESFETLKPMWRRIYDVRGLEIQHLPMILVGNKVDESAARQVPHESGAFQAKRWTCAFIETSAKNDANIKQMFQQLLQQDKQRNLVLDDGESKDPQKQDKNCSIM